MEKLKENKKTILKVINILAFISAFSLGSYFVSSTFAQLGINPLSRLIWGFIGVFIQILQVVLLLRWRTYKEKIGVVMYGLITTFNIVCCSLTGLSLINKQFTIKKANLVDVKIAEMNIAQALDETALESVETMIKSAIRDLKNATNKKQTDTARWRIRIGMKDKKRILEKYKNFKEEIDNSKKVINKTYGIESFILLGRLFRTNEMPFMVVFVLFAALCIEISIHYSSHVFDSVVRQNKRKTKRQKSEVFMGQYTGVTAQRDDGLYYAWIENKETGRVLQDFGVKPYSTEQRAVTKLRNFCKDQQLQLKKK